MVGTPPLGTRVAVRLALSPGHADRLSAAAVNARELEVNLVPTTLGTYTK